MKGSDVFPSKWLAAADLGDKEPTVIIDRVVLEEINDTEQKPVIYFKKVKKGMICNKTNWKTIAYIHKSDDSDDWTGKEVALYVELVNMQGQMKPALRVKRPMYPSGNGNAVNPGPKPNLKPTSAAADMNDDIPFAPEWR